MLNKDTASDLWKYSSIITGAEWPPANQPKSPCPTLKVVGAATAVLNAKEEAKRMKPGPGMVGGLGVVAGTAGHVVDKTLGYSVGTVMRKAQDALLGELPDEAVAGAALAEAEEEAPEPKRRFLSRLAFWRRKHAAEAEPVVAEVSEDTAPAITMDDAELEARLAEVLDGGLPLPSARAAATALTAHTASCRMQRCACRCGLQSLLALP